MQGRPLVHFIPSGKNIENGEKVPPYVLLTTLSDTELRDLGYVTSFCRPISFRVSQIIPGLKMLEL